MMSRQRPEVIITIGVVAASIVALWLVPTVGFIATAVTVILIAPWGRSVMERAIIGGVVMLGAIAVVFPRAGTVPLTSATARGFLSILVVAVAAGALVRAARSADGRLLPRFTGVDAVVLGVFVIAAWWPISAYIGQGSQQVLSSLYFGGWDNASHFITFANTYVQEGTTWTTADGAIAWNQWYPSLHTTLYALAQQAWGVGGLDRTGLLFPYAVWASVSFAASAAAITWIAGDLARRWVKPLVGRRYVSFAAVAAAGATGAWLLLGSPQSLLNAGFTNFLLGTALVAVVAYISARSWNSARTYGWFLIPLGLIAIIGLWTPLALVLVPTAVVVLIALWRFNPRWAIAWVVANAVIAGTLAYRQLTDVLAVEEGASLTDFGEHIGAVGTGMAPFNISAALAAPIIVIAVAVLLRHRAPLPVAVTAPAIATFVLAALFAVGSHNAGTSLLRSYYVLKSLDAGLLATAPIIAAAVAAALVLALRQVSTLSAVAGTVIAGVLALTFYGYVGAAPSGMSAGFRPAPGVEASWVRASGQVDNNIGEAILAGVRGAEAHPEAWPILWGGAGLQSNFWVAGLSGVPSANQMPIYGELGEYPYGDDAAEALQQQFAAHPDQRMVVLWYQDSAGEFLRARLGLVDPARLILQRVDVTSPDLCATC